MTYAIKRLREYGAPTTSPLRIIENMYKRLGEPRWGYWLAWNRPL